MNKKENAQGLLVTLGLGATMCLVFGVDGNEPVFLYLALAIVLIALGVVLAEQML